MIDWLQKQKTLLALLCLVTLSVTSLNNELRAAEEIKVSVTHFPPFYEVSDHGEVSGLGIDVISALNQIQTDYIFTPLPVSPRRRHHMFKEGRYDMSFFDHLEWGWDQTQVDATDVYLTGGEVFITGRNFGRDQAYFKSIKDKSIVAILGYHYQFADFESDPHTLRDKFNITLVKSQENIIRMVLSSRVEIGIITETYLHQYFKKNTDMKGQFLISKSYDQPYNFRTIVRKNSALSADDMSQLMMKVRKDTRFTWIKQKYGINW